MVTCLVDFSAGGNPLADPVMVFHGRSLDNVCVDAREHAGYLGIDPSEIEIYQILRNPDGDLYLADLFGDAIRSAGRV